MKSILLLLILGYSFGAAFTECPSFAEAQKAYQAEDYENAVQGLNICLESGLQNADVYYNLGNAEFRMGHIGKAIWAYESALRLNPTDNDILKNLQYARTQTVDKVESNVEENPVLKMLWNLHHLFSLEQQLHILLGLAWFAGLFLVLHFFRLPRGLGNGFWGVLFVMGIFATFLILDVAAKIYQQETERIAIVIAKSSDVMSGPGNKYQVLHEIHEGTRLEVRESRGEWISIRIGENVSGFVPANEIAIISTFVK